MPVKEPFAARQEREIPKRGPAPSQCWRRSTQSPVGCLPSHVGASAEFTFPTSILNPISLASPRCPGAVPSSLHIACTGNTRACSRDESAEYIFFKSSLTRIQHLPSRGDTSPLQTIHHDHSPVTQKQREAQQPLCPPNTPRHPSRRGTKMTTSSWCRRGGQDCPVNRSSTCGTCIYLSSPNVHPKVDKHLAAQLLQPASHKPKLI